MFEFEITSTLPGTSARTGRFTTPHGVIDTPVFMPVGTKATVKAMLPEEVAGLGASIILANTFHLHLRPGDAVVRDLGGLHRFMNWPGPILTDSGGFQVFSLADLRKLTEEGVRFRSPLDGAEVYLTPERAVAIQQNLGADIIMCLDECPPAPADREFIRKSAELSVRWAGRCREAHQREDQALFGIVQGGMYPDLREWSARATVAVGFPGHAIGGLSVGETKPEMEAALDIMDATLPRDKPRYLMGVGTPADFFRGVERGVDMFDCVLPTRTARNARLYTNEGVINLRNTAHATDAGPVSPSCACYTCRNYSRGYVRHLFMSNEILASRLATGHNLFFFIDLMRRIRRSVASGGYHDLKAAVLGAYPDRARAT